jgi:zinc transporter ZupT
MIHGTAFFSSLGVAALTLTGCWVFTHLAGSQSKDRFLSTLVALGAGYMLGLCFFELIPLSYQAGIASYDFDPQKVGITVVLGILAVIIANQAILGSAQHGHHHVGDPSCRTHDHDQKHDQDHSPSLGPRHFPVMRREAAKSALLSLSICSFFDGITVSSAHLSSPKTGFMILIGQAFHLLPEGIMAAGFSLASGAGKKRALQASFTIGAVFLSGSLVPLLFSRSSLDIFLPLSAGIVTYVTLSELLPEATEKRSGVISILGGMILYGIVQSILHRY